MKKLFLLLNIVISTLIYGQFGAPNYEDIISTEIIPEYNIWEKDIQRILVHTKIQDGFSYYWRNGGESGVPFSIEASLPDGVEVLDLVWSAPKYKMFFGQKTFAYLGGSWHLITLKKSSELKDEIKLSFNNRDISKTKTLNH